MAFKIRDEGDVLEHNLRFHHALGVDHFIVTDNGSTDETVDILARYAEAGLMTVIEAPNTDYREQGAKWMTDMARLAATELGADWVVHTDADEFWWPIEGSLSETLAAVHDRYGVLMAPRCEFIGRPDGPGSFAERLTIREARSRYQPKVAHRADPDVVSIDRGPHDVAAVGPSGDVTETIRPPGRPVHRVIRNRELGASSWPEEDTRLVWAPWWPVRILHFPVRSSAQFERRTQIAIFEGMFPDRGRFQRLREHYEEGRFDELYRELIFDQSEVDAGLRGGTAGRRRAVRPHAGAVSRSARRRAVGKPGRRALARRARARPGRARVRRDARSGAHQPVADGESGSKPRAAREGDRAARRGPGARATAPAADASPGVPSLDPAAARLRATARLAAPPTNARTDG